jgi:predicted nuclease of predicted toxin-antitoxin system
MARPKFIADADLSDKIIAGVRRWEPSVDFLHASDGGTRGLSDPEVLALAAASGRIVVSSDQKTMPAHFRQFLEAHESPGVINVPQAVVLARAIDAVLLVWKESGTEEFKNQLRWVQRRRYER